MSRGPVPPVDRIVADASPGERRLAVLRGGRPWRLVIERDNHPRRLGDVHLGRVLRVDPAVGGAFLDIGLDAAALLPLPRRAKGGRSPGGRSSGAVPREGESLVVQVTGEPGGGKGAAVSRRVALPSRLVVLTADQPGIAASHRLGNPAEADRLQGILRALARPAEGIVARAAAKGADAEAIEAELNRLRATGREIAALAARNEPGLLWRDLGPIGRCLRDELPANAPLLVEGGELAATLRRAGFAPSLWTEPAPLFEAHEVEAEIEAARETVVAVPGGGTLAIEPTRALVAIDVDGGPRPPIEINLAAAVEAVRQVRLRNLGGQVVIDFVTLSDPTRRRQVDSAVMAAFAEDPADIRLEPMNRLGLVAFSRQRLGPALHEVAPGGTAETAVLDGLRALARAMRGGGAAMPALALHPQTAIFLDGPLAAARLDAERLLGGPIHLRLDHALARDRWRIVETRP